MSKEIIPIDRIGQSIYLLRGQQVLLDFDLAALYDVATKVLNQAVKRNQDRFPADFMFRLTVDEAERLIFQFGPSQTPYRPIVRSRSQIVRLKRGQNVKHRLHAFTEQGVARKFAGLEKRVGKHDREIDAILEAIRQLMAPPTKPQREIGFHVREAAPRYRTRKR